VYRGCGPSRVVASRQAIAAVASPCPRDFRNRGSGVVRTRGLYSLGVQPRPRTRAESGDTEAFGVVESEVYDMWGNTGCRIRRKGRMWMSLLTRQRVGRILLGCCAVRGRIRGRSLVLRTSTLSGHRQSQESREPFAFGEWIYVVTVTQRVEYFVEW
jgi:hypothetical protein